MSVSARSPPGFPFSSCYFDDVDDVDDELLRSPPPDLCPMCQRRVSSSFLSTNGDVDLADISVREQSKFCRAHKRHEAEGTWAEKGYPTIRWKGLKDRLKKLDPMLKELLNGRRSSPFREELIKKMKKGTQRTLLQGLNADAGSEGCLTPGYYGSRGSSKM